MEGSPRWLVCAFMALFLFTSPQCVRAQVCNVAPTRPTGTVSAQFDSTSCQGRNAVIGTACTVRYGYWTTHAVSFWYCTPVSCDLM